MIGGGTFTTMTKTEPGFYFNAVSSDTVTVAAGERGYAAYAHTCGWGEDDKIVEMTSDDFMNNSRKIFGYAYDDDHVQPIREIFQHATVLYTYKLASGGEKATCSFATAKYAGTRGNALKVAILKDPDNTSNFIVRTFLEDTKVDEQSVADATNLVDNDFVSFKTSAALAETALLALSGGTDGTIDASAHASFMAKLEMYPSTNVVGYDGIDTAIAKSYVSWAKRMRDEAGVKVVVVCYNETSDYEGVIGVANAAKAVPWTIGAEAGCAENASLDNTAYDGELTENDLNIQDFTRLKLKDCLKKGLFAFHLLEGEVKVYEDINTLVTYKDSKSKEFRDNKTIRILDKIARDIARIFVTSYYGGRNDKTSRNSFKASVINDFKQLENSFAIENFSEDDVQISQPDKDSVAVSAPVQVVGTMRKIYMTVTVA